MARREQYGLTWWGKEWLRALLACDHDNRLPRGKTYCNKGNVLQVDINPETFTIEAVVQGSVMAYEVCIQLERFSSEKVEKLIDSLRTRSDLVARLLDNELPSQLASICSDLGLKLFPSTSHDLQCSCSCPDSARLCKHIAAVIYWLSRAIDSNPFLIFTLHGVQLVEKLKQAGLNASKAVEDRAVTLQEVASFVDDLEFPNRQSPFNLRNFPLKSLEYTGEKIFTLLPSVFTLGNSKNFPHELMGALRLNANKSRALLVFDNEDSLSSRYQAQLQKDLQRYLRHHYRIALDRSNGRDIQLVDEKGRGIDNDEVLRLISTLLSLPETLCSQTLSEPLYALRVLFRLVDRIYESAALIPVVVVSGDKEDCWPQIYWMPAVRYSYVGSVFADFLQTFVPYFDSLFDFADLECRSDKQKAYLGLTFAITLWHRVLSSDFKLSAGGLFFASPSSTDVYFDCNSALSHTLAQYLRVLNLSFNFPWHPIFVLTRSRDKTINLHYRIKAKEGKSKAIDLKTLMRGKEYEQERFAALNVLTTLKGHYPLLGELLEAKNNTVKLDPETLKAFLFEIAPSLTLLGISLSMPQSLKNLLKPKITASVSSASTGKSFFSKDALTDFNYHLAIGEHVLTEEEFADLVAHVGEVVEWADEYIYVDPEEIEKYRQKIQKAEEISPLEKLRAALTGEIDGVPVSLDKNLKDQLNAIHQVPTINLPKHLRAKLRPYQKRGYEWLMKNIHLGLGSLIADDMGLGKTLQVIAVLTALKEAGQFSTKKALIVVPTTLLTNWEREISKFSPYLKAVIYHGDKRKLPDQDDYDVLLTTYGVIRRDVEILRTLLLRLLVIDEAQAVKNHLTTLAQSLSLFNAQSVIAMSGTPVENHLSEYWSIFSLVQPGLLGTQKDFKRTFAKPIESDRDPQALDAFKSLTAPFMLRRLKTDKAIISDLPDRLVNDRFATLTVEQAALYQKTLAEMMQRLITLESKAKEEGIDAKAIRRALVLKLITSLKQICNSPSQYLKTETDVPDSGKGTMLLDLLSQNFEVSRKVLIFTQYREMGKRLQGWIDNCLNEKALFLHGAVSVKERMKMVDRFQNDPTVRVMILSLKAGGTGLNLTAASSVIHYDLWWNPAVESQATDRAYRIGQKRDVLVYRFVTAGTFEEKINEMLASKKELADLTVNVGEKWIGDLSSEELDRVLKLSV